MGERLPFPIEGQLVPTTKCQSWKIIFLQPPRKDWLGQGSYIMLNLGGSLEEELNILV